MGSATVEVQVRDTGGLTATDTFTVTVGGPGYRHRVFLPLALKH
jgi:hypothetical protein